jgi:hypothetical protein
MEEMSMITYISVTCDVDNREEDSRDTFILAEHVLISEQEMKLVAYRAMSYVMELVSSAQKSK